MGNADAIYWSSKSSTMKCKSQPVSPAIASPTTCQRGGDSGDEWYHPLVYEKQEGRCLPIPFPVAISMVKLNNHHSACTSFFFRIIHIYFCQVSDFAWQEPLMEYLPSFLRFGFSIILCIKLKSFHKLLQNTGQNCKPRIMLVLYSLQNTK